ncbi:hypothetical protein GCM10029978_120920 [Actinoallomurus acanthiterrae]
MLHCVAYPTYLTLAIGNGYVVYIGSVSIAKVNIQQLHYHQHSGGTSSITDEDTVVKKRITYRSKVKDQNYYSVAVNAGYYVTPNAKVYVEGAWNRVTNKKGNTSLYDHNDNTSDYSKNGAGIENYNFITTAGLKYTF